MTIRRRFSVLTPIVAALAAVAFVTTTRGAAPRFYPDDPIAADNDTKHDASVAKAIELSEAFDAAENLFSTPGDHQNMRALNVNTLDEVPDSSWFTNRIGRRAMTPSDILRGPDTLERFEVDEWLIVGGKGPAGFQPGFRAVDARDPRPVNERQLYQLELDLKEFPELATGAEMIGTTLYHAIGYNVVDSYVINVDPKKIQIGETATQRDASGIRHAFTRRDVDEIFRLGARNADGTYRMTAGRYVEGQPLGHFKHFGTRPDDPNDIYPHEHRRELRANRVFAAWINHDDSRALNTLDMLVTKSGRQFIKHYMFDFGAVLGSSPDLPSSGQEYFIERGSTLARLFSLGLWVRPWEFSKYRKDLWSNVGRLEADHFDPEKWKPQYPNQAFKNMRPDDAFWAARIVAAFSDEALAAVVSKAKYSNPAAADYVLSVLIKRRDQIARVWLNAVNPLIDFTLAPDGILTFENAAIKANVASAGDGYTVAWSRFDNATDTHQAVGSGATVSTTRARLPAELSGQEYVAVTVRSHHPDHPAWTQPVRAYFHREKAGWKTVGLDRVVAD